MGEPARKRIRIEGLPEQQPQVRLRMVPGGGESSEGGRANLRSVPTGAGVQSNAEAERAAARAQLKNRMSVIQGGAGVDEEEDENEEKPDDLGQTYDGSEEPAEGVTAEQRAEKRGELEKDLGDKRIDASGRSLDGDSLKKAEKEDPIGGIYKAAGIDQDGVGEGSNKFTRTLNGISRRKKLLSGAGIGGVTALIAATLLVTPIYRIPALMGDLESKLGMQVDQIVEARAERIIVNYLISRAGGNATNYVVTNSPLESLWRTYQSRRFEKKIFEKTGIQFVKIDNVIHVEHDGRDLGGIRNYDEVMKIINRGTIETKKDFLQINKSVTSVLRFHKASKEAANFKNRFIQGKGYSTPKVDDDKSKTAAEKAKKEVEDLTAKQTKDATGQVLNLFEKAAGCIFKGGGENCDAFQEADTENPPADPDSEEGKFNDTNGDAEQVAKDLNEASDEATEAAKKDRAGGFMNRMLEFLLKKIVGAALAKTIVDAIPYVGWINFAAELQHAFGTALKNHLAERIPIMMRQTAYGAIYASWEGYAHNIKAGKVPTPMLSALQAQLGDANRAAGHKALEGKDEGIPVSPKVGDDKDYKVFDIMDEVYNNFGVRYIIRGPLEVWYYTVTKLLNLIGDFGGEVLSWIMRVTGFTAAMEATMKAVFGDNWKEEFGKFAVKAILWLFGISIDPLAKGAEMFNNLFAGAAVALNWYCHYNLGCRVLTPLTETLVFKQQAQKQQEDMALTPLKDRLFSPDMPDSLTATLIRDSPTQASPGAFMASLAKQVAALPSSIALAFSPNARAATYVNYSAVAGVRWFGALPDDLKQDTAVELRQTSGTTEGITCPTIKPTDGFNACMADKAVIDSLTCSEDPNNCPEWKGQTSSDTTQ